MEVALENLTKYFGSVVAVDNLNLEMRDGEFTALLGPSGCGKTTTLLMIAGIYKPTSGRVLFAGSEVNRVPPRGRNLGMVFQSYALYPNMTVLENLSFPLRLARVPAEERRRRALRVAEILNMADLLNRRPAELSGGQQQRVALGRALVKEPDALLFDEPLSNLDARLRLTMRTEIKRLQIELGITSIFVTHDQVEAMTLADRIAIMREGRLESFTSPDETYNRPATKFVASFVGSPPMNFFAAEVIEEEGAFWARALGCQLPVSPDRGRAASIHPGSVELGLRPEDLHLCVDEQTGAIPGRVLTVEPLGRESLIVVESGGATLTALVAADADVKMDDLVSLRVDESKVQFFDAASERSLIWR